MANLFTEAKLNFKLLEQIGKGGAGNVFKANDFQLNTILAIKKIPKSSFQDSALFFEESKKLYLSKHQNIVEVFYGCKDDQFIYLAMPLYEKGCLKSLIDSRFLTSREIIKYSLQFLSGLNNVHVKKLIHFDVKLENVLLSKSNQALLSDFGVAQHTGQYGFSKSFGTTKVFAPPEYFQQAAHNLKFDIYQAGITIYRMCVGDTIFFAQAEAAQKIRNVIHVNHFIEALKKGKFPDRKYYFPHIPRQIRKVITKAIHPDPNQRYDSIVEMMNDIAKVSVANDWEFSTNYSGNEIWVKTNYKVLATCNNGTWEVVTTKSNRRKNNFCGKNLTDSQKNVLTYRCLSSKW